MIFVFVLQSGVVVDRCVTEEDLQFFKSRTEGELGAAGWKSICEKELSGELTYSAWFRILPVSCRWQLTSLLAMCFVDSVFLLSFFLLSKINRP